MRWMAVVLRGDFLADREENGLIVQLYRVGSFYGELYYNPLEPIGSCAGGPSREHSN